METIRCPYCDCKVRVAAVDAEDGACPECGAPVTGSFLFGRNQDPDAAYAGDDSLRFNGKDATDEEPHERS